MASLALGGIRPEGPLRIASFAVADDLRGAVIELTGAVTATALDSGWSATGRRVEVPLAFNGGERQQLVLRIIRGGVSIGDVTIEYYPRELYAALGVESGGTIQLVTALPYARPAATPTAVQPHEAMAVDHRGWAMARDQLGLPTDGSVADSLRALYATFARLDEGATTAEICPAGSSLATVRRMVGGACRAWCSGYARVTSGYLRSVEVPTSVIHLDGSLGSLANGVRVQSSEAHQTVEWWDGGGWRWTDPTFRLLEARIGDGPRLSLAEALEALADPALRSELVFTRLDAESGVWRTAPYGAQDPAFNDALARYLTGDKRLIVVDEADEVRRAGG